MSTGIRDSTETFTYYAAIKRWPVNIKECSKAKQSSWQNQNRDKKKQRNSIRYYQQSDRLDKNMWLYITK